MIDNGLTFDNAGVLDVRRRSTSRTLISRALGVIAPALLLSTFASPLVLGQDTGRIAFLRQSGSNCELVLMDLSPRAEVLTIPACTTAPDGALLPAGWSHAGAVRWLVFRRMSAAGVRDGVWAMLEDGTSMRQVFPQTSADFNDPFHPTLSRDDQWLGFTAKATGSTTYDVFIQSFDPLTATVTSAPINLTQGALAVRDVVVFSPSLPSSGQSSIAFTATGAGGLRDVYRMDLSFGAGGPAVTGGPTNLTNTSSLDEGNSYGLDWSVATAAWPSGRLAFTRNKGQSAAFSDELVHMEPTPGSAPSRVVKVNAQNSGLVGKVSWSPLADRIMYGVAKDLVAVSPDGRGKVNITNTANLNEDYPTWRP